MHITNPCVIFSIVRAQFSLYRCVAYAAFVLHVSCHRTDICSNFSRVATAQFSFTDLECIIFCTLLFMTEMNCKRRHIFALRQRSPPCSAAVVFVRFETLCQFFTRGDTTVLLKSWRRVMCRNSRALYTMQNVNLGKSQYSVLHEASTENTSVKKRADTRQYAAHAAVCSTRCIGSEELLNRQGPDRCAL